MRELIILDLKQKVNCNEISKILKNYSSNSIYISLTPYSSYIYDEIDILYKTFHDFISIKKYRDNILDKIKKLDESLSEVTKGLMIEFIKLVSFNEYKQELENMYNQYREYSVVYITDTNQNSLDNFSNDISLLDKKYTRIKVERINHNIKLKNSKFSNLTFRKLINKIFGVSFEYDWQYYILTLKKHNIDNRKNNIKIYDIDIPESKINMLFSNNFKKILENIIYQFKFKKVDTRHINFLTWINSNNFLNAYCNFSIFYQHGNYFYNNMIFKYSEILPANINLVFNNYTKKLFESLGAKKVYSVGSILLNKPIKEKKKKYDFLYITQGHDYTGNLQYVDFSNSLHSFDGYELYQKHKKTIKLFGTKFKDKKVIIRVHPTVVTNGVYVPFWELAEVYPNVTIDVSIPIHNLIEKSKYIISDYFITEFINRELHYKRDIILFQGAPTPLPEETIEDMQKMFILVDTVDDLEEKVANIETITKGRPRYDEIIEYYSSKKCDTKKVVTKILEKELNARI